MSPSGFRTTGAKRPRRINTGSAICRPSSVPSFSNVIVLQHNKDKYQEHISAYASLASPFSIGLPSASASSSESSSAHSMAKSEFRVFLQDGHIFYSYNSTFSDVVVPSHPKMRTFDQPPSNSKGEPVKLEEYFQPVWFNPQRPDLHWRAFIPLSPSFVPIPFLPLCWMPRIIHADTGPQCRVAEDDLAKWLNCESKLTRAASALCAYHPDPHPLPSPLPSQCRGHACLDAWYATEHDLEDVLETARKFFALWVGYLSYLITEYEDRPDDGIYPPRLSWFAILRSVDLSEEWICGIAVSTVYKFGRDVQRAGFVMSLEGPEARVAVRSYLRRDIPVWFIWTLSEERALLKHEDFSDLLPAIPPVRQLIKDLLGDISPERRQFHVSTPVLQCFTGTVLPRAGDDLLPFFNSPIVQVLWDDVCIEVNKLGGPSAADSTGIYHRFLRFFEDWKERLRQEVYSASPDLSCRPIIPFQTLIDSSEEYQGHLVDGTWWDFFARRRADEAARRLASNSNDSERPSEFGDYPSPSSIDFSFKILPPKVFHWTLIRTSGGKDVFMRKIIEPTFTSALIAMHPEHSRVYDAVSNELDLGDFDLVPASGRDADGDDDDDDDDDASTSLTAVAEDPVLKMISNGIAECSIRGIPTSCSRNARLRIPDEPVNALCDEPMCDHNGIAATGSVANWTERRRSLSAPTLALDLSGRFCETVTTLLFYAAVTTASSRLSGSCETESLPAVLGTPPGDDIAVDVDLDDQRISSPSPPSSPLPVALFLPSPPPSPTSPSTPILQLHSPHHLEEPIESVCHLWATPPSPPTRAIKPPTPERPRLPIQPPPSSIIRAFPALKDSVTVHDSRAPTLDAVKAIYLRYGFVLPTATSSTAGVTPSQNAMDPRRFLQALQATGSLFSIQETTTIGLPQHPSSKHDITLFVEGKVTKKEIPQTMNDLERRNERSLIHHYRLRTIHRVPDPRQPERSLYILATGIGDGLLCYIAVSTATAALFVVRSLLDIDPTLQPGVELNPLRFFSELLVCRGVPYRLVKEPLSKTPGSVQPHLPHPNLTLSHHHLDSPNPFHRV